MTTYLGPRREVVWTADGPSFVKSTCRAGHTSQEPNKGLGRARLATWETRHQHCEPTP